MWPWQFPLVVAIPYWICTAVCWRMLTGHLAWMVHRTAGTNKTLQPPIENWVGCGIIAMPLSAVWWVVLLFALPWPRRLTVGAEADGARMLRDLDRVSARDLERANDAAEKRVGIGEIVD